MICHIGFHSDQPDIDIFCFIEAAFSFMLEGQVPLGPSVFRSVRCYYLYCFEALAVDFISRTGIKRLQRHSCTSHLPGGCVHIIRQLIYTVRKLVRALRLDGRCRRN